MVGLIEKIKRLKIKIISKIKCDSKCKIIIINKFNKIKRRESM